MSLSLKEIIVESLYAQAMEKKKSFSSDGGLPVEDRWWDALMEAYQLGADNERDGLHKKK